MSKHTVKITNIENRNNGTSIVDFDVYEGYTNVGTGSVECGTEVHYFHQNRKSYQLEMTGDVTEATILSTVEKVFNS